MLIVFGVVKDHGGWSDIQRCIGKGTHIEIYCQSCRKKKAMSVLHLAIFKEEKSGYYW